MLERLRALLARSRPPSTACDGRGHAPMRQFPPGVDPARLETSVGEARTVAERVAVTARCRDADGIAKVADAGQVVAGPGGERVQIMHNGLRVLADGYYGHWMTDLIQLCRGHHEPQEERAFHTLLPLLPSDATMLELGGYWAYYSCWFLHGAPRRRAWVVEPDPAHLEIGRRNAALNGLSPVFLQGHVGATPLPPAPFSSEASGTVVIPRFSVPQLLQDHGLDRLDLLHCDAQGVEFQVLQSSAGLLASGRIRYACISTHAHQISGDPLTHQRCLALIEAVGGQVMAEHDVHESFSGDGLIVACFDAAAKARAPCIPLSYNRYSQSLFRNPLYDLALRPTER